MSFTKEELLAGLRRAREQEKGKTYFTFDINIYELIGSVIDYLESDNQPLKFEELKEDMVVWDNQKNDLCI